MGQNKIRTSRSTIKMKALVEEVNKVQRRIKVELTQEDVKKAFDTAYQKVRRKAKIHGFRPGKAPLNIIRKFYGESVAADVADNLVRSHLFSAIQSESLQPMAAPVLETADLPEEGKEYSFSAVIDIMPTLSIDGYKGLTLEYKPVVVGTSAVEKEIEVLQRRQAKTKPVEDGAAAVEGNIATISQVAFDADGKEVPELKAQGMAIELGKNNIFPEIETAVVGMKVGEEKKVDSKVPEEFPVKEIAGKDYSFQLSVEKIEDLKVPAADDEFAKDLGLESLEQLKENVSRQLENQAEQSKKQQLESSLLEQIIKKNEFDVPPAMVDRVIDSMIDDMQWPSDAEREEAKKNPEYRDQAREAAKLKAKNTLVLSEIIKTEKLEVSDEDEDAYIRKMVAGGTQNGEIDEKIVESMKKSFGPQAKENLLFTKALDFVIEHGTVKETEA